ncbi:hypothetical protein H5410_051625 [Solanum commersonii]|uniref:Uncharacterized protein n=1 Tax=Solanum commersonii TaxID=4109 RepID=A0A9J5X1A0_SOLCO|nr:hypothetical protein H5410_051625 [Solanum commersonii]
MIMKTLQDYVKQFGKKINIEKSAFYVYNKGAHGDIIVIEEFSGFTRDSFPLMYLGFRMGHAMKRKNLKFYVMWNKYCKRHRPPVVELKGGSQTWKHMLMARDAIDQEIWW